MSKETFYEALSEYLVRNVEEWFPASILSFFVKDCSLSWGFGSVEHNNGTQDFLMSLIHATWGVQQVRTAEGKPFVLATRKISYGMAAKILGSSLRLPDRETPEGHGIS